MRIVEKSIATQVFRSGVVALVAAVICLCSPLAQAQTPGNKAVYNSTDSSPIASTAYVDASVFDGLPGNTRGDVCADIYQALNSLGTSALMAVIDARGIPQASNAYTCTKTPWGPSGTNAIPSVILLPAGKIPIGTTWILPNKTRIIGEGADSTETTGTVLQASFSGSYMLQFGNSSICPTTPGSGPVCQGIGAENLTLDGVVGGIGGITNSLSQERTYVDHVSLINFGGSGLYGLKVATTNAQNSGPYSNLMFQGTGSSSVCAEMIGTGPTRGIHNINCSGSGTAGIELDASGNSLENITVSGGFTDGILVGSNSTARGNVILNVTGGSVVTNIIHVCAFGVANVNCSGANSVSDLTIMQVNKNGGSGQTTILDDNVPQGTASTVVTDTHAAIYAIGEPMGSNSSNGVSRFTTATHSLNVPTWLIGSGIPLTGTNSCTTDQYGSLYSDNKASDSATLYVCVQGKWTFIH
jgi:hypothetical protein